MISVDLGVSNPLKYLKLSINLIKNYQIDLNFFQLDFY